LDRRPLGDPPRLRSENGAIRLCYIGLHMYTQRIALCLSACAWLLVGAACSGGPSSGERSVLGTHRNDTRDGRGSANEIEDEIGLLGDAELDRYVSEIGQRLVLGLKHPLFTYSFQVVNDAQPNAFVLPRGFIYLSRGLLALANNEDELACVLGHELAHAEQGQTARQQVSGERRNPLLRAWRRAARNASFSIAMEHRADEGGQRICAAAGYDPMGMATLLASLRTAERHRFGFSRQLSFMDTHPGVQERAAINSARAGKIAWERDPRIGDPRAALLDRIEGIDIGQRAQSGVFVEHRFLHPVLDFQIAFPAGWQKSASHRVIGAQSPNSGAIVFLTADQMTGDPRSRAEEWFDALDDDDVRVESSQSVRVGRLPAWRLELRTAGSFRGGRGYATFVPYGEVTYRIIAFAPARAARGELGRTLTATRSFRRLSPENRLLVQAHRLRVVKALTGESLVDLGPRTNDSWTPSNRALFNALFSNHVFEGGEAVKTSRAEAYTSTSDTNEEVEHSGNRTP
jgi:predicted Zn-dependent protease